MNNARNQLFYYLPSYRVHRVHALTPGAARGAGQRASALLNSFCSCRNRAARPRDLKMVAIHCVGGKKIFPLICKILTLSQYAITNTTTSVSDTLYGPRRWRRSGNLSVPPEKLISTTNVDISFSGTSTDVP
ncbi:hypothetical protein EVAR_61735_1 [Eumeta japonica]|uniref:Uncharacterized protein n=1 Tax=Eumeta variegata TaxID=151549 RepID=A0A4C1YNE9_EUMVA|nr:hypothetical protein EVAR_61735_1 [Eumeta japonica]